MSRIGKLYRYYLEKIWQKNWGRIIVFTILIGVVWWFVIPWLGAEQIDNPLGEERNKKASFSEMAENQFKDKRTLLGVTIDKVENREDLENEEKQEKSANLTDKVGKMILRMIDSGNYYLFSTPFSSDNAFFFSKTNQYSQGKNFWKMLFNIAWWSLTGVVVLYWFIFEVFNKTFFPSRGEGEDNFVLNMTPGVKRSDLIWGKILAFLTFYFLINIIIFLIPFSVYYFWLGRIDYSWFALLALITVIVGPLLFFGLIFAPYLFFVSLTGQKWIFSTLITFSPLVWGLVKAFSSVSWLYKIERFLFDPIWFAIISLICGIFFLFLYYLRYQKEDLN